MLKIRSIAVYLLISSTMHVGVLFYLLYNQHNDWDRLLERAVVTEVELVRPEEKRTQIVPPTNQTDKTPPPDTNLRAQADSYAKVETVKRGREDTNNQKQEEAGKPQNKLSELDRNLIDSIATNSLKKRVAAQQDSLSGISDYLPHIPDGDLTFLNAKASFFAGFVRRVGVGVFSHMTRDRLAFAEYSAVSRPVKIVATMNLKGQLTSARRVAPSGGGAYDKLVLSAVQAGTKDNNPPKEAANPNGDIEFIFESQAWVRRSPTGALSIWIMLGVGLN